jgi:hypothetical protein
MEVANDHKFGTVIDAMMLILHFVADEFQGDDERRRFLDHVREYLGAIEKEGLQSENDGRAK